MKVIHILFVLLVISLFLYVNLIIKKNKEKEGLVCDTSLLTLVELVNNTSNQIYSNTKLLTHLKKSYYKSFPDKKKFSNNALPIKHGPDKKNLPKNSTRIELIDRINYNSRRINDNELELEKVTNLVNLINIEGMETLYTILNNDSSDGMIKIQIQSNCSKATKHATAIQKLTKKVQSKIMSYTKNTMKIMDPISEAILKDHKEQQNDVSYLSPDSPFNEFELDQESDTEGGVLESRANSADCGADCKTRYNCSNL